MSHPLVLDGEVQMCSTAAANAAFGAGGELSSTHSSSFSTPPLSEDLRELVEHRVESENILAEIENIDMRGLGHTPIENIEAPLDEKPVFGCLECTYRLDWAEVPRQGRKPLCLNCTSASQELEFLDAEDEKDLTAVEYG